MAQFQKKTFMAGFNPRTPCGVRLMLNTLVHRMEMFQSTHSLRSATFHNSRDIKAHEVSIHALLAECDITPILERNWFKSFNPRTPCGVRRFGVAVMAIRYFVSIHALLAECDMMRVRQRPDVFALFQSTHSLRSATAWLQWDNSQAPVSIHALLAECDGCNCRKWLARPVFQSTHSLRSATIVSVSPAVVTVVSIHALLAECDSGNRAIGYLDSGGFNPRTPCGVRHYLTI